jgi:hypothetical protein
MQQKNSTNPVHDQLIRHGVSHTPSASIWVVDSKPLELNKNNVMIAQAGCFHCGEAPALDKNS